MRIHNLRAKIKQDLFEPFKAKFSDILNEEEILVLWYFAVQNIGYMDIAKRLNFTNWERVRDILEKIDAKLLSLNE